ncbi:hypothetical protein [Mycoplasma seminis]|uniref:Lipoprotein n=1 Tax=Mycoplasma seminis TaxID=512749 RepID=A0ABY9HBF8_9MOLU|nr:hypothetical protein [Mycoplasma seminis]WLP85937.1 hypothetical protein Q8852_02215 [Mycoplasma seminis]
MKNKILNKLIIVSTPLVSLLPFSALSCSQKDVKVQELNNLYGLNLSHINKEINVDQLIKLPKNITATNDMKKNEFFNSIIKPNVQSVFINNKLLDSNVVNSYIEYLNGLISKFNTQKNIFNLEAENKSEIIKKNILEKINSTNISDFQNNKLNNIKALDSLKKSSITQLYLEIIKENLLNSLEYTSLKNSFVKNKNNEVISLWQNLLNKNPNINLPEQVNEKFQKFIDWYPSLETELLNEKKLLINKFLTSSINTFANSPIVSYTNTINKLTNNSKSTLNIKSDIYLKYFDNNLSQIEPEINYIKDEKSNKTVVNIILKANQDLKFNQILSFENYSKWYKNNLDLNDISNAYKPINLGTPNKNDTGLITNWPWIENPNYSSFVKQDYKISLDLNIPINNNEEIVDVVLTWGDSLIGPENKEILFKDNSLLLSKFALELNKLGINNLDNNSQNRIFISDALFNNFDATKEILDIIHNWIKQPEK